LQLGGLSGSLHDDFSPPGGHDGAIINTGAGVQWTPRMSTCISYQGQLGRYTTTQTELTITVDDSEGRQHLGGRQVGGCVQFREHPILGAERHHACLNCAGSPGVPEVGFVEYSGLVPSNTDHRSHIASSVIAPDGEPIEVEPILAGIGPEETH